MVDREIRQNVTHLMCVRTAISTHPCRFAVERTSAGGGRAVVVATVVSAELQNSQNREEADNNPERGHRYARPSLPYAHPLGTQQ